MGKSVTPFLWFESQAEEAVNFYVEVFGDAEIHSMNRYPEGTPMPAGTLMTVSFRLRNQEFTALNGGPQWPFSGAISFVIDCETQDEVDHFWNRLTEGGQPNQCGWLTDRFGITWQVVPHRLMELMSDPDPGRAGRATQAMMGMTKIEIAKLEAAAGA